MRQSAVLGARTLDRDVPPVAPNGWSVQGSRALDTDDNRIQTRTGLSRLLTCFVEPRQVPWLRKLVKGDETKLGDALALAVGRGLKVLKKKPPKDVARAAGKSRQRVIGSRMVALL